MSPPFPRKETLYFIQGPAGRLEVSTYGLDSESGALRVAIVCHPHPLYEGTMNNKVVTTLVRSLETLGFATVRFNFRGVGQSEGSYGGGEGESEDLVAVINWLLSQYQQVKLCLAGFSFGSYISANVAANWKHLPILTSKHLSLLALISIAAPVNHFPLDKLPLPDCPWIIIQGDQDEIVPFEKVQDWIHALQKKKKEVEFIVLQGASHFFHGRLLDLQQEIEKSMERVMGEDKG